MVFLLGLIILILLQKNFLIYQKYSSSKEKLEQIKGEEERLSLKESRSLLKLEKIKSARGIEEYFRQTYAVKKEGEGLVVLYDTPAVTYHIQKQKNLWEEFKEWYNQIIEKIKKWKYVKSKIWEKSWNL